MTDTTVAALSDDEITAMRGRHRKGKHLRMCLGCGWDYPCDTIRVLDTLAELTAENERLRERVAGLTTACTVYRNQLNEVNRAVHQYLHDPCLSNEGDMRDALTTTEER